MSAPSLPRPPAGPDPTLPPPAVQWSLRAVIILVHVIFVTALMLGNWEVTWWQPQFENLGTWFLAFGHACLGSLHAYTSAITSLETWAIVEGFSVALICGVSFQWLMRLCAAAGLTVFVMIALAQYEPNRPTLLLMVITEVVTVLLVLVARPAGRQDWQPLSALFTVCATFYFFALSFKPAEHPIISEQTGIVLTTIGVGWAIFAKLSLGRSFGLLPADRGIVTRGAYQVVRHPVYLGYFIYHLGFLLANFGGWNLAVFTLLYFFQTMRIISEERLLRANPEYQAYCQKVRWRFVPGIF